MSYLDSNKPEAERCVELAAAAWKAGDLARAERMLQKSLKLYPTLAAQRLIAQLHEDLTRQTEREAQRQEQIRRANQEAAQEAARQRQQNQQQSSSSQHHRPAAASAASPSKPAAAPAPGPPPPAGAAYTSEQAEHARLILSRRSDYYALFSVSRTATETEIKKSYRKMAVLVHPDKNRAPEAEEAFKLLSSAFTCLSDADKRAHYDAYGTEDNTGGGGRAAAAHRQYQRDDDLSPEDVFNMFFNGGMSSAGGPRRTYTYRRQARPQQHQQHAEMDSPAALFSQFAHFLPLLLLLIFGLLSTPSSEEQLFGLDKSSAFPVSRFTQSAHVPYYVGHNFAYRFQRDRRALDQVEAMVEAQAFKIAEESCAKQKRAQADEERRIKRDFKGKELAAKLQANQARQLDACERLQGYQNNAHGAKGG